ncbi:MAG: M24 family metallopeptidase [Bacillota bacterium]|jgi:Xaa-Pro aminopeptidase
MNNKISLLCQRLQEENIDALLITRGTNIRYLTGYTGDEAYLLVPTHHKAAFITDFRNLEQAEKETDGLPLDFIRRSTDYPLTKIVKDYCLRYSCDNLAIEKDYITYGLYEKLSAELGKIKILPCEDFIGLSRMIKTEQEIEYLKQAAAIADAAFEKLLSDIVPGITEKRLAANLEYYMLCLGAQSPAFDTIVASGLNGSQCHARPTEKILIPGEFIIIDFGANYQGYCSDCTRTLMMGKPSYRQKNVYETVHQVKNNMQEMARPGSVCKLLHLEAVKQLEKAGYAQYFGHGLGHGIGLDMHEAPYLNQSSRSLLKTNNAVTIEPGVYIPNWGGVRIEDSLIIGKEENLILSKLPTELICL